MPISISGRMIRPIRSSIGGRYRPAPSTSLRTGRQTLDFVGLIRTGLDGRTYSSSVRGGNDDSTITPSQRVDETAETGKEKGLNEGQDKDKDRDGDPVIYSSPPFESGSESEVDRMQNPSEKKREQELEAIENIQHIEQTLDFRSDESHAEKPEGKEKGEKSKPNTLSSTVQSLQSALASKYDAWHDRFSSQSTHAQEKYKEWEEKVKSGQVGDVINDATGYGMIVGMKEEVKRLEKNLSQTRQEATQAKNEYTAAVERRSVSQRQVNDLLQRKSSWSGADVVRFTELVQQDHGNEQAEIESKKRMEFLEETVEKAFSELMHSILSRYHEEQIWSDKIRSLSTYGTVFITLLNVCVFVGTVLFVEPWRRRRLVERIESRLKETVHETSSENQDSIDQIRGLLVQLVDRLDVEVEGKEGQVEVSTREGLEVGDLNMGFDSAGDMDALEAIGTPISRSTATELELEIPTSIAPPLSHPHPSPSHEHELFHQTGLNLTSYNTSREYRRDLTMVGVGVGGTVLGVLISSLVR